MAYKSPEALLAELTKSVGRGGVRIESKKSLPKGTRFVFELKAPGVRQAVEVTGTVESTTESAPGRFVLHIRYEPPSKHAGIDEVIERIAQTNLGDVKRKAPRIPMHVRAVEDRPDSPTFRLRDLSQGGVGIDVEADEVPAHIKKGVPFLMRMKLTTGQLSIHGTVVWVKGPQQAEDGSPLQPGIGVSFGGLSDKMSALLQELLTLRALPAPPWIARLSFGAAAVTARAF